MSTEPAPFDLLAQRLSHLFEAASHHFQAVSDALSATSNSQSPFHLPQPLPDRPSQHEQLAHLPNGFNDLSMAESRTTSAMDPAIANAKTAAHVPPGQECDLKPFLHTWPRDGSIENRDRAKRCFTSPSPSPMNLASESVSTNAADPLGRATPATPLSPFPAETSPRGQDCSFVIDPSLQQSCEPQLEKTTLGPDHSTVGPDPRTFSPDPRDTDERPGRGAQSLLARIGGSAVSPPKAPASFYKHKVPSRSTSSRALSPSTRMDMSESPGYRDGSRRFECPSLRVAQDRDYAEKQRYRDRPKDNERSLSPQRRRPSDVNVSLTTSNTSQYHDFHHSRRSSPPSAPRNHPRRHASPSELALGSRMAKGGHRLDDARDWSGESPYLSPTSGSPSYTRLVQLLKNLQAPQFRAYTTACDLLHLFARFSRNAQTAEEETMGEIYRSPDLLEDFLTLATERRIITLHKNRQDFKRSTIKLDIRWRYVS